MIEPANFALFIAAALVIAIAPGPGIFYVAARTLAGGRAEGLASSLGTGVGGMVHVLAGAVGVSALVLASAQAFTAFKIAGALYLVNLGIRTWRSAGEMLDLGAATATGTRRAFREGIVVEALNPKTAAFFLAFLPQFVLPEAGNVALQFVILGLVSVTLNTAADVVIALAAAPVRRHLAARMTMLKQLRRASAALLCGLGVSLALARRPG